MCDYVGKKFVAQSGYAAGEIVTINTQDKYGVYYELDEKQWIVPWNEIEKDLKPLEEYDDWERYL